MKIDQRVQEIWSGQESVTDGRTDGLKDEGHSFNPLPLPGGGLICLLSLHRISFFYQFLICFEGN